MLLSHRFRAKGVRAERADVCWDARISAAAVLRRLDAEEPELPALLEQLRSKVPALERFARSFKSGPYVRPAGHNRAFYMDLNDERSHGERGVLAFKGTEVAASNFDELLDGLDDRFDLASELPLLEHFPLVEHKVPGALLLDEARDEAKAAAAFQSTYLKRHGVLAHTPVPLLVLRWPVARTRDVAAGLLPRLSRRAAGATRSFLKAGLGVYVYYYPTLPIRVRHLVRHLEATSGAPGTERRRRSYAERRARLAAVTRPLDVVSSWIDLVVDMLTLGFLPVTLSHQSVGQCIREQNAVIDGGFVDVDSLQPFSRVRDDHEFHATLVQTMRELSDTIYEFLAQSLDGARPGTRGPKAAALGSAAHVVGPYVWMAVRQRLLQRRAEGTVIDGRVAAVLAADDAVTGLDAVLEKMFPGVSP